MTTRRAPHEVAPSNTDGDFFQTIGGAAGWGPPPSAGSLTVQDENGTVATGVTQIDFQGPGFTATAGTSEVVVTSYGTPVLLLAAGAAIPSGTPAGTIIIRKA